MLVFVMGFHDEDIPTHELRNSVLKIRLITPTVSIVFYFTLCFY